MDIERVVEMYGCAHVDREKGAACRAGISLDGRAGVTPASAPLVLEEHHHQGDEHGEQDDGMHDIGLRGLVAHRRRLHRHERPPHHAAAVCARFVRTGLRSSIPGVSPRHPWSITAQNASTRRGAELAVRFA